MSKRYVLGILFGGGSLFNSRPSVIFLLIVIWNFSGDSPGTEAYRK
jgi:hypothetical protein